MVLKIKSAANMTTLTLDGDMDSTAEGMITFRRADEFKESTGYFNENELLKLADYIEEHYGHYR